MRKRLLQNPEHKSPADHLLSLSILTRMTLLKLVLKANIRKENNLGMEKGNKLELISLEAMRTNLKF
jgi:hypothetical protein